MLYIVVIRRNRRLHIAYTRTSKLIFWISNNPRPSNLYILILKTKFGYGQTINFRSKGFTSLNFEHKISNILLRGYKWIPALYGHSGVHKKMAIKFKFSEPPNIPRGTKFWLVDFFIFKKLSWGTFSLWAPFGQVCFGVALANYAFSCNYFVLLFVIIFLQSFLLLIGFVYGA